MPPPGVPSRRRPHARAADRGPTPGRTVLRLLAAVLGGYAVTIGVCELISLALSWPMARSEAAVLASMLGFLIYPGVLIWTFASTRPWRCWAVLLAAAGTGHGLIRLLPLHAAGG